MVRCRRCERPFEPRPWQVKNSDFLCKPCELEYQAAWRAKRRADGLPASGSRTYNPEKRRTWSQEYYSRPDVRAKRAAAMRLYNKAPELRERHMARWILNRRIKTGTVIKRPCQICGASKVDAHHDDYAKPLDVKWFCRTHHQEYHAAATGKE